MTSQELMWASEARTTLDSGYTAVRNGHVAGALKAWEHAYGTVIQITDPVGQAPLMAEVAALRAQIDALNQAPDEIARRTAMRTDEVAQYEAGVAALEEMQKRTLFAERDQQELADQKAYGAYGGFLATGARDAAEDAKKAVDEIAGEYAVPIYVGATVIGLVAVAGIVWKVA